MGEPSVLLLLDAAMRGGLVALCLLLTLRLLRDRFDALPARIAACLTACLTVQAFGSLPLVEATGPVWWQLPLTGISVGNSVLFWVFAQSLFDDEFGLRPLHVGAWLAVVGLGMLFYAVVVMPQQPQLAPFALAVAIAMRWTPIVFAGLVVLAALRQWPADLVERRRRLRGFILVTGTAYTIATAVARLVSPDGRLSEATARVDVAMLLLIIAVVAARVLRAAGAAELLPADRSVTVRSLSAALPPPAVESPAESPSPAGMAAEAAARPTPDAVDDRLAADLQRLMTEDRAYRDGELTVARLADRLKTPEYRLRRLINQRLGHRNFNAYVNGFRLDEAQRWLADPEQREVPILTIALDSGFQSIGPFNRAFKAATGQTPSEFRRQRLADS